jgi:hypothetical protein
MKVHDVKNTLFWDDIWAAEVPLRLKFPRVYGCCRDKNAIVRDCWASSSWDFDFCRTFGPDELKEWEELLSLLQDFNFSDSPDRAIWVLEKTGVFSTRSLYRSLSFRGVINKRMQLVWESKLPMKIKVFLWLGFQNRLPSGAAQPLSVENGKGDGRCDLCRVVETIDHIFFHCCMARFVWVCFKEALGWDRISVGMKDFLENWLPLGTSRYKFKLFLYATVF